MKRIFSIFLLLTIAFTLVVPSGAADEKALVTIGEATGTAGDTVSIDVSISNNPGFSSFSLDVLYDENLTLTEIVASEAITDFGFLSPNLEKNPVSIIAMKDGTTNTDYEGVVVTLTFTISDTITTDTELLVEADFVEIINTSNELIDCEIVNGCVKVDVEEPAHVHTYDEGVVTKPTCTEQGYTTYTCTTCEEGTEGHVNVADYVQATGHEYEGVVTEPTCTEQGYTTYTCSVCGVSYTDNTVNALGHNMQEEERVEATCNADGYVVTKCTRCGATDTTILESSNAHTPEKEVERTEATCEDNGSVTYLCAECGNTYTQVLDKLGHDKQIKVDNATCSEAGKITTTCSRCDYNVEETIPATGEHTWGDWEKVSDTKQERTCEECGLTEEKTLNDDKWDYVINSIRYYAMNKTNRTYTVKTTATEGGEIKGASTVKYGKDATYDIIPEDGYEVVSVKVNGKEVGAVYEVTLENVRANAKIEVVFEEIVEETVAVVDEAIEEIETVWENPFVDIFETDSYYEAIEFVYENGLFKGVSETEFAPDTTMTRAMFVTVLGRLHGVEEDYVGETTFEDVVEGEWYAPYVAWAAENGIVNGYSAAEFGVNDEITIEQAAVIIARYAAFAEIDTAAEYDLAEEYADAADVAEWAVNEMTWAVAEGIYTGAEGNLNPQAPATRVLVATMLYNFSK